MEIVVKIRLTNLIKEDVIKQRTTDNDNLMAEIQKAQGFISVQNP